MGAVVPAGAWAGELAWGSAAAFGALAVLMFPATIGRQRLVRAGIVLAVLLPTAGFVAMLSAGHWSLVVVIAAAGAVIGSVAAGNPAANGLGVPILATMIGLSGYPVPFDQALVIWFSHIDNSSAVSTPTGRPISTMRGRVLPYTRRASGSGQTNNNTTPQISR